jgi:CMP-N,N'-diacetyllegionaminic acid synthase
MEVLAVIGARGGSKTLPGKNVALLGGKPLIGWTIEAALGAALVNRTIVTTDDPEIAMVARRHGAELPFMRPAKLAGDETPSTDAIIHAVEWLESYDNYRPDIVVSLQPTSPQRTAADIDAALSLMTARDADSVVSVTPADPHPYWTKTLDADGWITAFIPTEKPIIRRQDLPPVYALNGAIYAATREVLLTTRSWYTARTAAYIMPSERSLDIDTAMDFRIAQTMIEG